MKNKLFTTPLNELTVGQNIKIALGVYVTSMALGILGTRLLVRHPEWLGLPDF